jgi:large subunit ribosomal protein L28
MSRICELTGRGVQFGNKVSHSERKTRRTFRPNLQTISFFSDAFNRKISFRAIPRALKSVEINGGIDAYLLSTPSEKLSSNAVLLKKKLQKMSEKRA